MINPDRHMPGHQELMESSVREVNWPRNFGYHGDLPIGDTWALGPVILHRDSDTLQESNAAALLTALRARFGPEAEGYDQGDDEPRGLWEITRARHWATGWVEHISYHARTEASETDGTYTPIHAFIEAWFAMLADYPIADELDYSRRCFEEDAANA